MSELKIEYIPLADIKPYEHNAKLHPNEQIEQIMESIEFVGFDDPIAIWKNNEIIEGHGRYEAAKRLGMKNVPIIRLDKLTDEQRRAYALIHNKLTMNSGFDVETLNIELAEIQSIDMGLFDFEMEPIKLSSTEVVEDDYSEEPPAEPKAKLGDIYQLGRHRLMCGDTFTDLKQLLENNVPDVLIYDPPFEHEELYEKIFVPSHGQKAMVLTDYKHFGAAVTGTISKGWQPWYEMIWDNVQSWYTKNRPLAQHKTCYIFGDTDDKQWDFDRAIIYDGKKRQASHCMNAAGRGEYYYEPLEGAKHLTTVYEASSCQMHDEHGQGKPVIWFATMLMGLGGKKVFDCFGGSGTALIACEQIGAECYSMEIEPRYVDEAIER